MSSLTVENGNLVFSSPFNLALKDELKMRVPEPDRRWDGARKVWVVAPAHGQTIAALAKKYLGESLVVPTMGAAKAVEEQRFLEVRYIGACKDRGAGEMAAYGYCNGGWSVLFPEKALRGWFENDQKPDEAPTLYAVLGITKVATDTEIKSAYRRMARQWHPDVCREPGAAEQFKRINAAYQILADPGTHARYDAGLALEDSLRTRQPSKLDPLFAAINRRPAIGAGYRSPLRCGYIVARGHETLGRFVVSTIDAWEDITRADGRVLVTSWSLGAETFIETWS